MDNSALVNTSSKLIDINNYSVEQLLSEKSVISKAMLLEKKKDPKDIEEKKKKIIQHGLNEEEKEFMENYKEQTPKEEPTKVVNKDNNINFKDLTDVDLQFLASSGKLTDSQLEQVNNEIMNREKVDSFVDSYEKPKIFQKKYNGFSSLVFLCLVTGIGGMSIFLYILLMIG